MHITDQDIFTKTPFILHTDGTCTGIPLEGPNETVGLQAMQTAVGGLIEFFATKDIDGTQANQLQMIGNEEGKLIQLPFNLHATYMWHEWHGIPVLPLQDIVVGDVLICTYRQSEGPEETEEEEED